ncbi:MAG: hypothetical protein ACYTFY_10295 [Planctomycetota bacterium]|jgi:hypothetical protein
MSEEKVQKVEIEVIEEEKSSNRKIPKDIFLRLHRAIGPVAAGLIIDFIDLATFGPLGFILGPVIGAAAGWWIASIYNYSNKGRIIWAIAAGIYCSLPFTEIIPLATIVSAIARFGEQPESENEEEECDNEKE